MKDPQYPYDEAENWRLLLFVVLTFIALVCLGGCAQTSKINRGPPTPPAWRKP